MQSTNGGLWIGGNMSTFEIINTLIRSETERITEKEILEAQQRISAHLKASIPQIALSIADHYSIHDLGNRIIIEVKHKTGGKDE